MNRAKENVFAGILSSRNKYVYFGLVVIFILSIFLRYYGFRQEHGLTFDEGLYAHLLGPQLQEDPSNYSTQTYYRNLIDKVERPLPKYLDRPLFKHPPLYCYLIALNYQMFGRSDLVAVSVSIILGSLMVLLVFFFGKFLYDERVGLLAAAFLSIEPIHWVCSERIWMETTLSFFILLGVFLFAIGRKYNFSLALSGLAIGLAMFTKGPGVLALFIIGVFALLFDRSLLKKREFWLLCFLALLVFSPWIIWSWRAYGDLNNALFSVHNIGKHFEKAGHLISANKMAAVIFLFLTIAFLGMREKIKDLYSNRLTPGKKKIIIGTGVTLLVLSLALVPFLRDIVKGAFVFKKDILVEWWNPFSKGPLYFYLIRLIELSPLFIFSYLSIFLFFGDNKGDKLLILSSAIILTAFILWGNYQSRYILPAVPFLVILSARWQVWAYDKLSGAGIMRIVMKCLLIGVVAYFVVQTLKVDSLIAIGPDFGYF